MRFSNVAQWWQVGRNRLSVSIAYPFPGLGGQSNFPREITETALAHVIGDNAEEAYRRSDAPQAHGSVGGLLRTKELGQRCANGQAYIVLTGDSL
jgi:hypothetical protein